MDRPHKYPSTKHWPWSETVHRDDSIHNDPSVFLNRELVITEKLDGGNTSLWKGEVYARSNLSPSHAGWMAMVRKHHGWKTNTLEPPFSETQFYGEDLYGVHSITYEKMREDETYRLFAARSGDTFHSWSEIEEVLAPMLSVPTVPVLYRGVFQNLDDITAWFELHRKNPSSLGGECEGFVIRIAEEFHADDFSNSVVKYVRANHVQTDQHWTRNWQPCELERI